MSDEHNDYAWRFTGDPWLDGIIFAAASVRNKHSILINVSFLPAIIVDKIKKRFDELGYQVDSVEVPNALTRSLDLRLDVVGPCPIFGVLPKFSQRRLDLEHTPLEFARGTLLAYSSVNLSKYSKKTNYPEDGILIRGSLPKEDIIVLLDIVGIKEYRYYMNKIYLDRSLFQDIEPFETLYREFVAEDKYFCELYGTREEHIEKKMDQIGGKLGKDRPVTLGKVQAGSVYIDGDKLFAYCEYCDQRREHRIIEKTKEGYLIECVDCNTRMTMEGF